MIKSKNERSALSVKLPALFLVVFVLFPVMYASGQTKFGDKTAPFFKIFSSGTYHMKAKSTSGGTTSDTDFYCKGGISAIITTESGESMRIVLKDKKMYMIFETSKMMMITPSMEDQIPTTIIETDKIKFTGSGTAVFAGKSLPYDEYAGADGGKSQYFVDGNKLAGIRTVSKEGTEDAVVAALDQNIPNNVFDIPGSGYTVQDMSGMGR